jgi:hypothetical protein
MPRSTASSSDGQPLAVVFVHGWSVTSTSTYGYFPARLKHEAEQNGILIDVHDIWLSRYVSFHDEVRIPDLSRAFENAVRNQLKTLLNRRQRFVCITHSTGGPVVRDWWHRYYLYGRRRKCPMSHLIMLAPANFGSALAQLGKGALNRMRSFIGGIEVGQGVLDWLELGSEGAWELNRKWVDAPPTTAGDAPVFPFVLTAQSIDRRFYDTLNSYTGEMGSDGVVRVAAANINTTYLRLEQQDHGVGADGAPEGRLVHTATARAQETAFALVAGKAHSNDTMGIMRSVPDGDIEDATVSLVLRCIAVRTQRQYKTLCAEFREHTAAVVEEERLEKVPRRILPGNRRFVHDSTSMVIFRVVDSEGVRVTDFRLMFTGNEDDPNQLPSGFFIDRQKNRVNRCTLTYFFNYDAFAGAPSVPPTGRVVRGAFPGLERFGLRFEPEPYEGFSHYLPSRLAASQAMIEKVFRPHETTMVEIVANRYVRENAFELQRFDDAFDPSNEPDNSFKRIEPGGDLLSE